VRVLIGTLVLAVFLAGCGGGGASKPAPERHAEGGGEAAERAQAVRGVPPSDRAAFFQVATATGTLRHWAAETTLRRPAGAERAALRGAASRLRIARPENQALASVRDRALIALGAALDARAGDRRAGRRALVRAQRLTSSIDRLVRHDPRFSALVPD
jgi:hypothetical protein